MLLGVDDYAFRVGDGATVAPLPAPLPLVGRS